MINKTDRKVTRTIRQKRVRTKVQGTSMRPRLCVFKSLNNIYAQVIDDEKQTTICSASTLDKEVKAKCFFTTKNGEIGTWYDNIEFLYVIKDNYNIEDCGEWK